jgi:hypothetical protein
MLKPLLSRSGIAYMSVFVVIACLIIFSNILTQITFAQEITTRSLASTMSLQELRTQSLFRNGLLAIVPAPHRNQLNSLKVDPIASLKSNLTAIEATNKILISPATLSSTAKQMRALQPDFILMDKAGRTILVDVASKNAKDAGQQIAILFIHEQKYLQGTYAAYQDLTRTADDQINSIMQLERIILALSLITLAAEARFVAWPLIRDHYTLISEIDNLRTLQEQRREDHAEEDHSDTSTDTGTGNTAATGETTLANGEKADH